MPAMRFLLMALLIVPLECKRVAMETDMQMEMEMETENTIESSTGQMARTGASGCKAIDSHGQSLRDMWDTDQLWKRCLSCDNDNTGTVSDKDLEKQFQQKVSKGSPCSGFSRSHEKGQALGPTAQCADIKASDGSQLCHAVAKFLFGADAWEPGFEPHWNRQAYCVPCTPEPEDVVQAVSFPGNYLSQLGGENWQPTDARGQAERVDGVAFALKLHSLIPGDYHVKAVINPEKNGWGNGQNYGVGGVPDGGNVHFRVDPDVVDTTLSFNIESKLFEFTFERSTSTIKQRSASFPGNYAEQLGGGNWNPTDALCQGERSEDGVTFTLKLRGLAPGEYLFKAVIDAEKDRSAMKGWANNYGVDGVPGGPNVKFTVEPDVVDTTLMFYTVTKMTRVSFERQTGS